MDVECVLATGENKYLISLHNNVRAALHVDLFERVGQLSDFVTSQFLEHRHRL